MQEEVCQGYYSSLLYTVNVTGAINQVVQINPTQCGILLCATNISIFPGDSDKHVITLATWNESVLVGKDTSSIREYT